MTMASTIFHYILIAGNLLLSAQVAHSSKVGKEKSREIELKIFVLNTWGMPKLIFGGQDKEARMAAIGQHINQSDYDLCLLQEVWMRSDHQHLRDTVGGGWFMTEYGDMNGPACDGRITPGFCSGLAILSKYPFMKTKFFEFSTQGSGVKSFLGGKGVGLVKIAPEKGLTVDILNTHTAAWKKNKGIREIQLEEIVDLANTSKADLVILGGDLNIDPFEENVSLSGMVNAKKEFLRNNWLDNEYATWGNIKNYYTEPSSRPKHLDYVFYRKESDRVQTSSFSVLNLKTKRWSGQEISISDHEAISTTLKLNNKHQNHD